jgi:hypothetical protein
MTYRNDPNRDLNRPADRFDEMNQRPVIQHNERWGTGSVVLASLAALAIVFGLFYAMWNRGDTTLARTDRPAVTTPAETTGSGAVNRNPDSTGTKPAMPAQVPAPASPPAANR